VSEANAAPLPTGAAERWAALLKEAKNKAE
jgi:hypothetical protein